MEAFPSSLALDEPVFLAGGFITIIIVYSQLAKSEVQRAHYRFTRMRTTIEFMRMLLASPYTCRCGYTRDGSSNSEAVLEGDLQIDSNTSK